MSALASLVRQIVAETPVWDMHTHLYSPRFGTPFRGSDPAPADPQGFCLWGFDELMTYHYLVAEFFRVAPDGMTPDGFRKLEKSTRADLIWEHLFVRRTPLSEACRGVVTVLDRLGYDLDARDPATLRAAFASRTPEDQIDEVLRLAGVKRVTMTNDVFDPLEHAAWRDDPTLGGDDRFAPVLRCDRVLNDLAGASSQLASWGYDVPTRPALTAAGLEGLRRFFDEWIDRMRPIYLAASLPPEFYYGGNDDGSPAAAVLRHVILPAAEAHGLPMALMIGVRRGVNPALADAGDASSNSDLDSLTRLLVDFPGVRFLVTLLAREDQHQLAVLARKFGNLTPFGCWWFLNIPSIIDEMTSLRLELLGTSFIPQHSDARVLEHLIYKWGHSREVIADVLVRQYEKLANTRWPVREDAIRADVTALLDGNFAAIVDAAGSEQPAVPAVAE